MSKSPRIRLPAGLHLIADVAGIEVALKLALEIAPERLHVPKVAAGSRLALLVGIDAAEKIVKHYGGQRLNIPLGKHALIHHLLDQGVPVEKIGKLLKMSRRMVQYVKNGRPDGRQLGFIFESR